MMLDVGARVIKKAMMPRETSRNLRWARKARMSKRRRRRKDASVCSDKKLVASG
jgi:hypothetical protein